MAPKVFFITGSSSGFGEELVKIVLEKGDIAVATARDPSKLLFSGTSEKNYMALALDVTDKNAISSAIKKTTDKFGRIDVLVNNAGYGLCGVFESYTEDQIRSQMEANFFGLIDVTRAGLEVMREQKPPGGTIQQVTSIGGRIGVPTFSLYCASKFAIEGFTEALSKEVKPEWGIKFTNIEPGGFRTNWANGSRSMFFGKKDNAYDHINAKENMDSRHGTQAGDPPKAASAMYQLAMMEDPPLRCILGTDAYKLMTDQVKGFKDNLERFERLSNSTDVDEK